MPSYLIIGASSGIGLATAKRLAHNSSLFLVARNPEKLSAAIESLTPSSPPSPLCPLSSDLCPSSFALRASEDFAVHSPPPTVHSPQSTAHPPSSVHSPPSTVHNFPADITIPEDRARLIADLPEIDGLVYSAGANSLKPVQFITAAFLQEMTAVHFQSPLLLLSELLKKRKLRKGGSVVWIGSVAPERGSPGNVAYSGVKAALMATVKPLAVELARSQIRVNAVAPGLVESPLTDKLFAALPEQARQSEISKYPLGLATVEDVAEAVAFLLGPSSKHTTGTILTVDGGYLAG